MLSFNHSLEFTINAFFFSDDTMHKIHEDQGNFNPIHQLPQILYSTIISEVFDIIVGKSALTQDITLAYKSNKWNGDLNRKKSFAHKKIKIKIIFYFILSYIFLCFFWYYISIFCVTHANTQLHSTKDTLLSYAISLIKPIIINLSPGIFRIISLSNSRNNRKALYVISKFIQVI